MSIFESIVKKFKKEKVEQAVFQPEPVQEFEPPVEKFDFETKEQSKLLEVQRAQNGSGTTKGPDRVYDLNNVYWVFMEDKQSGEVKAVPMRVDALSNQVFDLVNNQSFVLEEAEKSGKQIDDDMSLFSVKVLDMRRDFRVVGSGRYYNLQNKKPVDSYNAGAPALIKLISRSFGETDFSKIFDESPRGVVLKDEALATKRDITKMNAGLEKTYKQDLAQKKEKKALAQSVSM